MANAIKIEAQRLINAYSRERSEYLSTPVFMNDGSRRVVVILPESHFTSGPVLSAVGGGVMTRARLIDSLETAGWHLKAVTPLRIYREG